LTLDAPFVVANHVGSGVKSVDAVDGWGVGGPSRARVMRGGILKIGDMIEIDHPVTGMGTDKAGAFADPSLSGNIGGGILKRFVVTFDYGHSTMYLKPLTGPIDDLDTYDRAGTWFNVEPDGFKVVAVTHGGPAEEAGLKADDVITAIDGKAVGDTSLDAVRRRLRNDPVGTLVKLAVLRSGKPIEIALTLRDQI
jgi:membrane-associated protease RseP (regulator of RpoE activity)